MKKIVSLILTLFFLLPAVSFAAKCGDAFKPGSTDVSLDSALNDCTPDGAITTKTSVPI
jgi:hypothetical protein